MELSPRIMGNTRGRKINLEIYISSQRESGRTRGLSKQDGTGWGWRGDATNIESSNDS